MTIYFILICITLPLKFCSSSESTKRILFLALHSLKKMLKSSQSLVCTFLVSWDPFLKTFEILWCFCLVRFHCFWVFLQTSQFLQEFNKPGLRLEEMPKIDLEFIIKGTTGGCYWKSHLCNDVQAYTRGSGWGSVGRAVTSDTRDLRFKSQHQQNIIY